MTILLLALLIAQAVIIGLFWRAWRITDTSLVEARHELAIERDLRAYWLDKYLIVLDTLNAQSQPNP